MGSKNSFINKPLGSVGDNALGKDSFLTKGLNTLLSPAGMFNPNLGMLKNVREGLGEITGANATRKAAMNQQQANEEATKRAADASDAASRAAGGDPTAIFLATGKKKKGAGGSGTGSAGTGSSRDTGVQS